MAAGSPSTIPNPRTDDPAPRPVAATAVRAAPRARESVTRAFTVGDAHGYLIASRHPDGTLADINLIVAKHGSTLHGMTATLATAISTGLQHGVPLATFVRRFTGIQFAPAGPTNDPDIPHATSIIDYVIRRLAADHLTTH
jgi:hypothetical protein